MSLLHHAEKAASHVGEDNPVDVLGVAARGAATQDVCPAANTTIHSMETRSRTSCDTYAGNNKMMDVLQIIDAAIYVPLTTLI